MIQKKFIRNASLNTKKNAGPILFLIVIFGLAFRLIFFSGVGTSDDLAYSKYAYNIQKGIDPGSTLTLSARLGLLYPTALSYHLFGVNDFSSVLFVLIAAMGNIILAYLFGNLLGSKKIGLIAAFLLAIFPLEVVHSTELLADLPSSFFMALGAYVFLYSEKKSKPKPYYFLSGALIGIGYLIRESAVLIVLFFLMYAIYTRRIKKEHLLAAAGFILIFTGEILAFYSLTGNPLFRFTATQDYLIKASIAHNYFGRLSFPQGLFHYPYVILTNSIISFFYAFIFAAIIYFLKVRRKETYILLLWFIPLLLYLSFGSSSFSMYIPFKAEPRYLSVITMPGILLLAFFFSEKNRAILRMIFPLGMAVLLISSVMSAFTNLNNNDASDNLKLIYPYLKDSKKAVYTDERSKQVLEYLSGYKNTGVRAFPENLKVAGDSYIIINKAMIGGLMESNANIQFPAEVSDPPKKWIVLKDLKK